MRWPCRLAVLTAVVLVQLSLFSPALSVAGTTLGVEDVTRDIAGYGYKSSCIQHNNYRLELHEGIFQVPILALYYAGPYVSIRERAEDVAANMEHAFDLIEMGGVLEVVNDPDGNPSVWVKGEWDYCGQGQRIITIYSKDAELFPRANGDQQLLAEYVRAITYAHYTLFVKNSLDVNEYDELDIDKRTAEGKIFKAIFLKVRDLFLARNANIALLRTIPREERPEKIRPALQETAQIIGVEQHLRLYLLAFLLPRDWTK